MSPQKISAITLCATAIGFFGCRDPFADCLPGFVELDDGNCGKAEGSTSDTDPTTTGTPDLCGNGNLDPGEVCDIPPNNGGYNGCRSDCQGLERYCGDQVPDSEEDCDPGMETPTCNANCTQAQCGDGIINNAAGENCDDMNGDNTDACVACQPAMCGDSYVGPGEACDDGNSNNYDACVGCQLAMCGDGFIGPGEVCDDGPGNNGPQKPCLDDCTTCGNGMVQAGETCDDGNTNNNDSCVACQPAKCGDGYVGPGEVCDDGPGNNGPQKPCLADCTTCGNGMVQAGEECDDGNKVDDDGCGNACVKPRLVFVTEEEFKGSLNGLDGADAQCANQATTAGLPAGKWRAWLSDSGGSPSVRFDTNFNGWYQLPDLSKTPVAKGVTGLSSNKLALITVNENGQVIAQDPVTDPLLVWSNTTATGEKASDDHCGGWKVGSITHDGRFGNAGASGENWTDDTLTMKNPQGCNGSAHLYCFQDI